MKLPVPPPDASAIFDRILDQGDHLKTIRFMKQPATDQDGRYLHWDKLRYLQPPEGFTAEEYWGAIKRARQTAYRKLSLLDKNREPFVYLVTDLMQRDLHQLDQRASGQILAPQPIVNEHTRKSYLVSTLIEESVSSSQLEGAATTSQVAKAMLREQRPPRDRSEQMICNNYLALKFVQENRDELLTKEMILELHRIVTDGTLPDPSKAGCLRSAEDRVVVTDRDGIETLHLPPEAEELEERLERLCAFANQQVEKKGTFLHPLLKAMLLHFMVGYDHPFVDGNGRTARALFYWYALKQGYWLLEFLSISAVLKEAPAQYMKAYLHSESDGGDTTYFLIHQLETLQKSVERLYQYLARKSGEVEEAEKLLSRTRLAGDLNHRQLSLLEHALKHPGAYYSIEGHKNSHQITYQTARTDLMKLWTAEILFKRKQGKAFVFVAPLDLKKRLEELRERL